MRTIRKVIRITAEDSPNVRYAAEERRLGRPVSNTILVPGVLSDAEYQDKLRTLDEYSKVVSLEARFYDGASVQLFPQLWLQLCVERAAYLNRTMSRGKRTGLAMGIDPAEGGDRTAIAVVDRLGLICLWSEQTPDTTLALKKIMEIGRAYRVPPDKWILDRAFGKGHADRLRREYRLPVQTVSFGSSPTLALRRGRNRLEDRQEIRELKTLYKNRRVEMYWDLSELCDPGNGKPIFGIPRTNAAEEELHRQLLCFPKTQDDEGRAYLPPKGRTTGNPLEGGTKQTLAKMLGASPDETDALVLAVHGLIGKAGRREHKGANRQRQRAGGGIR